MGSIVAENDEKPDAELIKKFEAAGFKTIKLPRAEHVVRTIFPNKTRLAMYVAIQRVWHKLGEHITVSSTTCTCACIYNVEVPIPCSCIVLYIYRNLPGKRMQSTVEGQVRIAYDVFCAKVVGWCF